MIKYKLLGKVGIVEVTGELPRTGDIIVVPNSGGTLTRFRVWQVQHSLAMTTSVGHYNTVLVEVHVELVD